MNNTKSLNCCSCGAGLSKPVNSLVKCAYCGNFNKILPNNTTLIYREINNVDKSDSSKKIKDLTFSQKAICVLIVAIAPMIMHKFSRKKNW